MTLVPVSTPLLLALSVSTNATTNALVGPEEPQLEEPDSAIDQADATNLAPTSAAPHAAIPRRPGLRPSTKPHELGGGLGLRVSLPSGGAMGTLPLHYLYHLQNSGAGPAVGGLLDFGFTSNILGTQLGPAFRYDVQIFDDIGLYVGPQVAVGYGVYAVIFPGYDPLVYHGGFLHLAANVRLALGDVGFVFARPVQLTAVFVRGGAGVTYDIVLGGGLTF